MAITTQRTSKPLKAFKFFANLIQLFGIVIALGGVMEKSNDALWSGFQIVLFGVALHIVARAMIWWNND